VNAINKQEIYFGGLHKERAGLPKACPNKMKEKDFIGGFDESNPYIVGATFPQDPMDMAPVSNTFIYPHLFWHNR
jgi:hypothetical protein